MCSERIARVLEEKLSRQRYAGKTIRSDFDQARLFLKHISQYEYLQDEPLSHMQSFTNDKVNHERIAYPIKKRLVGAIKKLYGLFCVRIDHLDNLIF